MNIKKTVNDFTSYELVMFGTAFFVTASVIVVGLTPVTLLASLVAPVVAGVALHKFEL